MQTFDWDVIQRSLGYLFRDGMVFTLKLTVLSALGGVILGTILAMMRLANNRFISGIAAVYVNGLRALPLLLVIFWVYFISPYVVAWFIGSARPVSVDGFRSAWITFTLFEAAFFCEIMRAGIQSIPRGQVAAGQALGMTYIQVMTTVILPQAFRNMMPILLTQTIVLFQDTSLVYVLSLTDFMGAASKIAQRDGRLVEMYVFAAVVYFIICFVASRLVRRLQQKIAIVR